MDNRYVKILASGSKAPLMATPGHLATNHSHINYYLDMTTLKTRLSEAQEIAKHLAERFLFDKVVDLTYENEQLRSKIQVLQDKLEKAYEFMKQFVIGGSNMLDVFRERIVEVKEWVHRKVAGMGR